MLTQTKLRELREDIFSSDPPDIIAITELKPKYYTRELPEVEYKLTGYSLQHVNFKVKNSTWVIARNYIRIYMYELYCVDIIPWLLQFTSARHFVIRELKAKVQEL